MKKTSIRIFVSIAAALLSLPVFADNSDSSEDSQEARLLVEARNVATTVPAKLLAVLQEEIARGGPESAVDVCHEKAPLMAKSASEKTGWNIRRVSLKNRNPKAMPDEWERTALQEFETRLAAGEQAATLEKSAVVNDGDLRLFRYVKALPTQPLCLSCHGNEDQISHAVKVKLDALYPQDKAVGYAVGQIRGAITLKRPL